MQTFNLLISMLGEWLFGHNGTDKTAADTTTQI